MVTAMPVMPVNMLMEPVVGLCGLVSVGGGRVLAAVIGAVRDTRVALAGIVVVMMVPMVATMVTVLMLGLVLVLVLAVVMVMVLLISVAPLFAPITRSDRLDFIMTRARCECCGAFSQILSRLIRRMLDI